MSLIFYLSGENLILARAEVEAFSSKPSKLDEHLLIMNDHFNPTFERLAFTRKFGTLLFESSYKVFLDTFKSFNWNSVYTESY